MPSEDLISTSVYRVFWVDEAKTILCLELRARWNWNEMTAAISAMNTVLGERTAVKTYSVAHFLPGVNVLPSGPAISKLGQFIRNDPQYEELAIFVRSYGVLYDFLLIASRMYGLQRIFARYRFVRTFEEALALIEEHRKSVEAIPD